MSALEVKCPEKKKTIAKQWSKLKYLIQGIVMTFCTNSQCIVSY